MAADLCGSMISERLLSTQHIHIRMVKYLMTWAQSDEGSAPEKWHSTRSCVRLRRCVWICSASKRRIPPPLSARRIHTQKSTRSCHFSGALASSNCAQRPGRSWPGSLNIHDPLDDADWFPFITPSYNWILKQIFPFHCILPKHCFPRVLHFPFAGCLRFIGHSNFQ
jgi:hypothetical protein